MPRLLLITTACATAVLGGCGGDRGERAYYRSRYVPEHVDETYTSIQRAQWRGDPQVFELPSLPPALNGEHYKRINCELPGPQFKPTAMLGQHGEVEARSQPELVAMGGMDTRPVPLGALDPLPGYSVGGMHDGAPTGVYNTTIPDQVVGVNDRRLVVAPGVIVTREPPKDAVMRDIEKDDYCLPEEVPPQK